MGTVEGVSAGALTTRAQRLGAGLRRGWRPAAGWVCVAALAVHYVIGPSLRFVLGVAGAVVPPAPQMDVAAIVGNVTTLLGLGAMRSVERVRGQA